MEIRRKTSRGNNSLTITPKTGDRSASATAAEINANRYEQKTTAEEAAAREAALNSYLAGNEVDPKLAYEQDRHAAVAKTAQLAAEDWRQRSEEARRREAANYYGTLGDPRLEQGNKQEQLAENPYMRVRRLEDVVQGFRDKAGAGEVLTKDEHSRLKEAKGNLKEAQEDLRRSRLSETDRQIEDLEKRIARLKKDGKVENDNGQGLRYRWQDSIDEYQRQLDELRGYGSGPLATRIGQTAAGAAETYAGSVVGAGATLARAGDAVDTRAMEETIRSAQTMIRDLTVQWKQTTDYNEKRRLAAQISTFQKTLDDTTRQLEEYRSGNRMGEAWTNISDKLNQKGLENITKAKADTGKAGGLLVDAAVGAMQMGLDLVASGGISPMAAMAVRSFGNGAEEARQKGYNEGQQIALGVASAAIEYFSEKLFGGNPVYDEDVGLLDQLVYRIAGDGKLLQALASAPAEKLYEGFEEMVSDLLNPVAEYIVAGNYDPATTEQLIQSGIVGVLTALVAEGGQQILTRRGGTQGNAEAAANAARAQIPQTALEQLQNAGARVRAEANLAQTAAEAPQNVPAPTVEAAAQTAENVASEATNTAARTIDDMQERIDRQQRMENVQSAEDIRANAQLDFGPKGQEVAASLYDGSTTPSAYYRAFSAFYRAGVNGAKMNTVPTNNAVELSTEQQKAAYNAGKTDAAASLEQEKRGAAKAAVRTGKFTDEANRDYIEERFGAETAERISTMLKATGTDLDLVDMVRPVYNEETGRMEGTAWAEIRGPGVTMEKNAPAPMRHLGHEWTHRAQEMAPEAYRAFRSAVASRDDTGVMATYAWYRENGENIDMEKAMDEYAADVAGRMLNDHVYADRIIERLRSDRTVLERLRDAIQDVYRTVKAYLSGEEARAIRQLERKLTQALQDTAKQVEENRENKTAPAESESETRNSLKDAEDEERLAEQKSGEEAAREVGVHIDEESESANPTLYSLKTWNESDYVTQRDEAAKEMAKALGISQKKAKAYIDSVNSIAKLIADDRTRLDYEASPGRSSFVSNAEYGGSVDFSTVCKKRRLLTGTMSAIQNALRNTALSVDEVLQIRQMMKDRGYEVSCGLCYVEGSRAKMGEFAQAFIELYKKHNPDAEWIPDMYDVNTPDGAEQMRIQHPDVYKQYEYFWNHYGTLKKGDPNLFASQQKPKLFQQATEYNGEILNKFRKASNVEEKNRNGGLRLQSFSDFEIIHLLDNMQVITDMARVGLAGQAYTKVPDFAWALGDTGLKINLSLIAKGVDANGHVILDEVEGMPRADAEALRDRYSDNVGTILVVFNDEQLKAAMADDFVDFIIPFHKSQWTAKLYDAIGLPKGTQDYTDYQNEKLIRQTYHEYQGRMVKDKATNYMPNTYWDFSKSGKENAETYLRMCAENNKVPKFYNLLVDNGDGSYSLQPDGSTDGYWKLLIDFKMYSNEGVGVPQRPVTPDFNMEEAERMLRDYRGGHQNYPVAQDVVDDFLKGRAGQGETRYSLKSDDDYMAAVERGDTKTQERMVREAAEAAGAVTAKNGRALKLYHGTPSFGFTKFGDGVIFTTPDRGVAAGYGGGKGYADPRRISEVYKADDGTDATLIQNTKNVLHKNYRTVTDEDVEQVRRQFSESADKLNDITNEAWNYGEGFPEMPEDVENGLNWMLTLPGEVNENLNEILEGGYYTEEAENTVERFNRYREQVREWFIDHRQEILDAGNENLYRLITGFDLSDFAIDVEYTLLRAAHREDNLVGETGGFAPKEALREQVETLKDIGSYEVYGFLGDNPLEIDAQGAFWASVKAPQLGEGTMTTDDIVRRARDAGYTSVVIRNVMDPAMNNYSPNRAADNYIFFNSNQVKSADPVTYDNNGNVIPLSERFNPEKEDIRNQLKSYRELGELYGTIPEGEMPFRVSNTPRRTRATNKVSQTVRTILEAEVTPDEMLPTIEQLVVDDEFSYTPYSDKAAIANADYTIRRKEFPTALADWTAEVQKGIVNKTNTALGWALYNNAVNSGDTKAAIGILTNIVQHQRNAAQAVQATRILKKLSPEMQLYTAQRSVNNLQEEINKRYGKKAPELKINEELAEEYLGATTEEERKKALQNIYRDIGRQMPSTFRDRWNAWRYLAMLGNARTHIRNIVGNAGFAPAVVAKDITATALEGIAYRMSGGKIERTKANILNKEGLSLYKAAFQDYARAAEARGTTDTKYSDFANANKYIEEGRRVFGRTKSGLWNKTGGAALEAARRGNSNLLEREDAFFKRQYYALSLAQYAKANGITAEQIRSGKIPAAATEYAYQEALKATYNDTNAFSEAISRLGRTRDNNPASKALGVAMEGVLPFRKTPANILVRGVEYSPLGLLKSLTYDMKQVKKGEMTTAQMLDNLSAGLTGTGIMALGVLLASLGVVRGAGGDDEKKKKMEELEGHQAYSMELPDGTSITLDWLAPESLPFFIGVNLYESTLAQNENVTMAEILSAIGNVSEPLLEMSCLQSLNDVFDAVGYAKEGDLSALSSALSSAATSYLTQAFPTVLGQAERTGESSRMQTFTEKDSFLTGDMQYTLGRASARIPRWDYKQIPYIDAWGREETSGAPLYRAFSNFLNPAFVSKIDESEMEQELLRVYEATGEGGVLPSRPSKYVTVDGERKYLTGEEYVMYASQRGQLAYQTVTSLVQSKAYQNMSDADKAEAIKDAYQLADQTARVSVGGAISQTWVTKAAEARSKGIQTENYIVAKTAVSGIEGLKDKNGKTIDNSPGLLKMEAIYAALPGLSKKQYEALFEYMGVGKTVIGYSESKVKSELNRMRKQ